MATITQSYLDTVPQIYKDVLAAYPSFDPTRLDGDGLAFQSLYSILDEQYTLGEIEAACRELEKGGAIKIKNKIFAHPTELGEQLIEALTGHTRVVLPPFLPPPPPGE